MVNVRTFALQNPLLSRLDGSQSTVVGVERLNVGFDRTWSPHVQVQVQLVAPDPAALAAIDPRTGFRLRFTLLQDDLQGHTLSVPFDLHYRGRDVDWVAGSVMASASSDEALWQDWADASPGATYAVDSWGAVEFAARRTGTYDAGRYTRNADAPSIALNPSLPSGTDREDWWEAGVTAWDYASQQAETAGAWLYCDEVGMFRYAKPDYVADPRRRVFSESTNLLNVVDSVNRDAPEWANLAIIGYTAPSSGATTQYIASSSGLEPRKALVLQRPRRKPQNASAAASKVRTQAQGAGRRLTMTAVADLAWRPNQPATATYRGLTYSGTLESVNFTFPEGSAVAVLTVAE